MSNLEEELRQVMRELEAEEVKAKEELSLKIRKAVHAGDLDARVLTVFNSRSVDHALSLIPISVARKYDIPEVLRKSETATSLSKEDIHVRILDAVRRGAVKPELLGLFNARPDRALSLIPADVRKSYGLPSALDGGDTLHKSHSDGAGEQSLSCSEIADRILNAVRQRKLDPRFLGLFNARPEQTLQQIPADVSKSFDIPRTVSLSQAENLALAWRLR